MTAPLSIWKELLPGRAQRQLAWPQGSKPLHLEKGSHLGQETPGTPDPHTGVPDCPLSTETFLSYRG